MEYRGIYISRGAAGVKAFAIGLIKANDRIGDIITEWRRTVRPDEAGAIQGIL